MFKFVSLSLFILVSHQCIAQMQQKAVHSSSLSSPAVAHTASQVSPAPSVASLVTGDKKVQPVHPECIVISISDIAGTTKLGQQMKDAIEQEQLRINKMIQQKVQDLQKLFAELEAKKTTMSDAAYTKERRELERQQRELEQEAQRYQEEMKIFIAEKQEELFKEIYNCVRVLAESLGVFEVRDKVTGMIIYSAKEIDHTQAIAKMMDLNFDTVLAARGGTAAASKAHTAVA